MDTPLYRIGKAFDEFLRSDRNSLSVDQYCSQNLGIGRAYAYRARQFYQITEILRSDPQIKWLPQREALVRRLSRLNTSTIIQIWKTALEISEGKPTQRDVLIAQSKILGITLSAPNQKKPDLSRGRTIPVDERFYQALKIEASHMETSIEDLVHQFFDRIFEGKIDPVKRRSPRGGKK